MMDGDQNPQRIQVFQQAGSGESKIRGIRDHGAGLVDLEVVSIDVALPAMIDEPDAYLPRDIHADLVLDFLKHPDLSHALALLCRKHGIPVIARGKRWRVEGVLTPPT